VWFKKFVGARKSSGLTLLQNKNPFASYRLTENKLTRCCAMRSLEEAYQFL
jgi:hypothetical protein